ncbi:hypothetical protein CU254_42600 (plasmid) [Amycolatopsis sp. AA4]|uniref:hypothetical protein n=1 Tax=Actinomycetes TaxID=1760 RepID=UPI0001B57BD9|nr:MULTISPECIES: hypothetical protein [Actinomycetes]ATY17278.1 hypothetical protein CU254_42600 [Amycolatopsis sp. AA4]EFL12744.1 predicted protein [Streptomyces sp. AA4]
MSSRNAAGVRYAGRDELDQAAARLWAAVQALHPELPVTAPPINAHYPAEPLPKTAPAVAVSVLREAARTLADVRGEEVVRRGGRYHNKRFAELAAEVGLRAETDPTKPVEQTGGFAVLSLPDDAKEAYREEIEGIRAVLQAHPVPDIEPRAPRLTSGGAKLRAECSCTPPRKIYASKRELARGGIVCTWCGKPFVSVS